MFIGLPSTVLKMTPISGSSVLTSKRNHPTLLSKNKYLPQIDIKTNCTSHLQIMISNFTIVITYGSIILTSKGNHPTTLPKSNTCHK